MSSQKKNFQSSKSFLRNIFIKLKSFLTPHKVIIYTILGILLLAYVINIFIDKHIAILAGEYIFSFDYLGHVINILFDPRSTVALDNTNCFDCPDFYHYSRWYSLFKIGYQSIGQIVFLHPFIFLIISSVIMQLVSLYIFVKVFFKKILFIPFFLAATVFIIYPYKYSLLVETHDGLLYSCLLLYSTSIVFVIRNIQNLSLRRFTLLSFVTGLLLSTFFNVNIGFFPIAFYTTLLICAWFAKRLIKNLNRSFVFLGALLLPTLAINIPLLRSLIEEGASRHYEGYLSFNSIDSFLVGLFSANADIFVVCVYALLFIFCFFFAALSKRQKFFLALGYLFVAVIVLGENSPVNVYGWMFEHLLFLDSFRATYRLLFFEFLILFIIVYFALVRLSTAGSKMKIVYYLISALFVFLPLYHIVTHKDYFLIFRLPDEYFEAQQYLNNFSEAKIYFPPTTNLFHSLATDYTWSDPKYSQSILLYKNPYTSLLPIHNLIQFERFPYVLSDKYLELRYLTDLHLAPEQITRAMELRDIKYVIVDKNYKWAENYPTFPIDTFIQKSKVIKRFGNLYVLELSNKSNECSKGYGTIQIDSCTSYAENTPLHNKSKKEYTLEVAPDTISKPFTLRKNAIYTKSILDPQIHQSLIDNRVLFHKSVMQMWGNQSGVFYTDLEKGKYSVYVQLFKYTKQTMIFGQSKLVLKKGDTAVKILSPYTDKPGMYWTEISVSVSNKTRITIDIQNKGYIILGSIPLIEKL